MFISVVLPFSFLLGGMWLTASMLSASTQSESLLALAQYLYDRAHDETLWVQALGRVRGLHRLCGVARIMVGLIHARADLDNTYSELRSALWRLYTVSLYCICVEAPLKASILPRLPRWAAWKALEIYTDMRTLYDVAIEIDE